MKGGTSEEEHPHALQNDRRSQSHSVCKWLSQASCVLATRFLAKPSPRLWLPPGVNEEGSVNCEIPEVSCVLAARFLAKPCPRLWLPPQLFRLWRAGFYCLGETVFED